MMDDKRLTICGLCLNGNNLINIFDSNEIVDYKLADLITELLRHEVSVGDIYPPCICTDCTKKLREFKRFKDKCDSCREFLYRAHAAKLISSLPVIQDQTRRVCENAVSRIQSVDATSPNTPIRRKRQHCDDNLDLSGSMSSIESGVPLEGDLNVESEGQTAHGKKSKADAVEVIAIISSVKPKITGFGKNAGFSVNMSSTESGVPVGEDPNVESEGETALGEKNKADPEEVTAIDVPAIVTQCATSDIGESKTVADNSGDTEVLDGPSWLTQSAMGDIGESNTVIDSGGNTEVLDGPSGLTQFATDDIEDSKTVIDNGNTTEVVDVPTGLKQSTGEVTNVTANEVGWRNRETENFLCPTCGNRFVSWKQYLVHIQGHEGRNVCFENQHTPNDNTTAYFECGECNKLFSSENGLKCHVSSHSKDKDHTCNICGNGFESRKRLMSHVSNAHGVVPRWRPNWRWKRVRSVKNIKPPAQMTQ